MYPHQFSGKPPLTALILHPNQQNEILKKMYQIMAFQRVLRQGYSGFQVTRMIEGLFGFEIFHSGLFLGGLI